MSTPEIDRPNGDADDGMGINKWLWQPRKGGQVPGQNLNLINAAVSGGVLASAGPARWKTCRQPCPAVVSRVDRRHHR